MNQRVVIKSVCVRCSRPFAACTLRSGARWVNNVGLALRPGGTTYPRADEDVAVGSSCAGVCAMSKRGADCGGCLLAQRATNLPTCCAAVGVVVVVVELRCRRCQRKADPIQAEAVWLGVRLSPPAPSWSSALLAPWQPCTRMGQPWQLCSWWVPHDSTVTACIRCLFDGFGSLKKTTREAN